MLDKEIECGDLTGGRLNSEDVRYSPGGGKARVLIGIAQE